MKKKANNDFYDYIRDTVDENVNLIKDIVVKSEFQKEIFELKSDESEYENMVGILRRLKLLKLNPNIDEQIKFLEMILAKPVLESKSFVDETIDEFVTQICFKFDTTNNDKMIIEHPISIPYSHAKKIMTTVIDKYYHLHDKVVYPFIISKNKIISGRIIQQIEGKSNYFLVSCLKKRTKNDEYITTTFLGDPNIKLQADNFMESYYTYKFITSNETEDGYNTYILLSKDLLPIDEVTITGMSVPIIDNFKIGATATLTKGTELIYVVSAAKTIKEINHYEFKEHVENYTNFDELYTDYFSDFRQPPWFEKFLLSILFSSKGPEDYPSHLGLIGPAGCGKSKLLESMASLFKEVKVSSASTLKGLTPNFGGNVADPGEFIRCRRWFLVDEFFRIVTKSEKGMGDFGDLNALLVHDTSRAVSGKHNEGIMAKPTATMLFATNFVPGRIKDFMDMVYKIDNPFLSRCILYNYTEAHVAFIKDRQGDLLKNIREKEKSSKQKGIKCIFPKPNPKLIEQVDYLKSIIVMVDYEKIKEISKKVLEIAPDDANIREIYIGRAQKHIEAIIDGVTKVNYIIEHRTGEFTAQDEDYKEAEDIWYYIVGSWVLNITRLPFEHRIKLLNPRQYVVYSFIKEHAGCMEADIIDELKIPVSSMLNQLIEYKIIRDQPIGKSRGYFLANYVDANEGMV